MRRIYYLLSLLCCFLFIKPTLAQTNVYYPFASDSKWSEATYSDCDALCSGGGVTSIDNEGFYYRLTNDTMIINGKAYRKLNDAATWSFYQLNNDTIRDLNYGPPFSEATIGVVREDSLHRIYYRSFDIDSSRQFPADSDVLIYDFSLVPGDSTTVMEYNISTKAYIVGYDSTLVGNSYRKTLLLSGDDSADYIFDGWCEGVGSLNGGLFERDMFTCEFCGFNPECFSVNDTVLLPANFTGSCDTIVIAGINSPAAEKSSLQIFPNPASDKLFLKFSQNFNVKEISIYNYLGQKVYSTVNIPGNYIDVSKLPAGLYFITATDERTFLNQNFIKE